MKLNCETCVKRDVCGHTITSQELCKRLSLNREFQDLQRRNISISISCNSYLKEEKVLTRGDE